MEYNERLKLKMRCTAFMLAAGVFYIIIVTVCFIFSGVFWGSLQEISELYSVAENVSELIWATCLILIYTLIFTFSGWIGYVLIRLMITVMQIHMLYSKLTKEEICEFFEWDRKRKLWFYSRLVNYSINKKYGGN